MNDNRDTSSNTPPDDALMRAAAALPREIKPGRDLWPGIELAISGRQPRNRWWNGALAQAAALLLLVGGSSGVTYLVIKNDAGSLSPVALEGERVFVPVSGSFGSRYNLGPEFQDARDSLAARLDSEMEKLSPESRAEVQKNLNTIRAAIVEINKALANEPDNVLLQDLLIRTYHDELTLMQKVGGIRNSAMRRTDI
jgi:hypothetical protein